MGKTALVNYWLTHRMGQEDYRGAHRVFGWSFYSQGTREDRQASSDIFLVETLKWFDDEQTALSEEGPWQKGLRLAELVQQHKTLLILDGVEPLQYPPGPMQGRLKDQGLQALLKQLAAANRGLCIVTTREKILDIEHFQGSTLTRVFLEDLSKQVSIELLRSLGVKGNDSELELAIAEFGGHPLTLNLLGNYLRIVYGGHILKRHLISDLAEEQTRHGTHTRRIMVFYERWLKDRPELDILYLLGLSQGPVSSDAINALRKGPPIKGLTERVQHLSSEQWQSSVRRLREIGLVSAPSEHYPDYLDCHPLVRMYFAARLKEKNPSGWEHAQRHLYGYHCRRAEKLDPESLREQQHISWEIKPKTKVFISYAKEDWPMALRLYNDLQHAGVMPWLDRESLLPGQKWREAIIESIRDSRYFLALLSPMSLSKNGFVQKEVKAALDKLDEFPTKDIFVIPVRIKDCIPGDDRLKGLHWVDLFPSYESGLEKLLLVLLRKPEK